MQSMIASQQQLIRRNINYNSINGSNGGNGSNGLTNNQNNSNSTSCDELKQSQTVATNRDDAQAAANNSPQSRQQSIESPSGAISVETNQSIGGDSSDIKKSSDNRNQVKKKRSNSSWLNILNPSYKSRHEEFKRLFSNSVPNNERLVVDYSCALQKDILVHGRLYLSLNYIAFYANIFKWETSLVIKCRDITSLTKAYTARLIPNAIQVITTSGDKYVFTSFAARDKTHVMLFRIWQNALLDQPMSSAELWQWVHYNYGDDLGLTSDDEEEYSNDNMPNDISTHSKAVNHDNSDSCHSSDPDFSAEQEVYEDCLDQIVMTCECKCASHEGKLILDLKIPVDVDHAFELMFTDNKFIHNLHKSRQTYDLCVTQWEDSQNNDKIRQLNYTVALNHTLVKSAPTIEVQRLLQNSIPGSVYMVRSEADNVNVPYCDTFSVHSQWCLTLDSANVARLRVHAKVFYKKNTWSLGLMKPMIEKSSIQGITDYCNDLSKALPIWIEMERNLALVSDIEELKINAKNIDYIDSVSSVSSIDDTMIQNVSERLTIGSALESTVNTKGIFTSYFHSLLNDTFLLKLILVILVFIFVLNIMVFIRLWQIESRFQDLNVIPFTTSQFADDAIRRKQLIDSAIKMVKVIETNLLQLKDSTRDEL